MVIQSQYSQMNRLHFHLSWSTISKLLSSTRWAVAASFKQHREVKLALNVGWSSVRCYSLLLNCCVSVVPCRRPSDHHGSGYSGCADGPRGEVCLQTWCPSAKGRGKWRYSKTNTRRPLRSHLGCVHILFRLLAKISFWNMFLLLRSYRRCQVETSNLYLCVSFSL